VTKSNLDSNTTRETSEQFSVVDIPHAERQVPRLLVRQTGGAKQKSRANAPLHPELSCLRFWAFLLIFAHHFFGRYQEAIVGLSNGPRGLRIISALFDSASLGLDMFFCLSSFLITGILLREFEANGRLDLSAFLARRALRIFPLYFGFLALTVFVLPHLLPNEHLSGQYLVAFLLFGANWICAFQGFPASVAAPLWSVSGEQQFYALWPVLLGWLSPRRIVPLALGCILLSTVARASVLHLGLARPAIWANTLAHLDPIAVGALCSVWVRNRQCDIGEATRRGLLAFGLGLPVTLLFILGPSVYHSRWSMIFYPAAALACGSILVGVYRQTTRAHRPWLVHLGQISYGLFVFHTLAIQLVQGILVAVLPSPHGMSFKAAFGLGQMSVALALTIGVAMLSYRFYEEPFLRYKAMFRPIKSPQPAFERLGSSPAVVLVPK
jgi:peptidoglycan/LPS O-acetylase OafA/YrhL